MINGSSINFSVKVKVMKTFTREIEGELWEKTSEVEEVHTYQISYLGKGFWRRFFPKGNHPVRKNVSVENIQKALDSATEFILYKNQNDSDVILREDFEQMVASVFKS